MIKKILIALYVFISLSGVNSLASDKFDVGVEGNYIYFRGPITKESSMALLREVNFSRKKKLIIQSEGGNVDDALIISDEIKKKSINLIIRGYCASSCANYILPSAKKAYLEKGSIVLFHGDVHTSYVPKIENTEESKKHHQEVMRIIEMERKFYSENKKSKIIHLAQKVRRASRNDFLYIEFDGNSFKCMGKSEYIWIPSPEILIRYKIIQEIINPVNNVGKHINTGNPDPVNYVYDNRNPFDSCMR